MTEAPESRLAPVRQAYDAVAEDYAAFARDLLHDMPLDRALLGTLVGLVRAGGAGTVGDLGCGPGFVTAHLAGLGADVVGFDLSPGMVRIARREHPHLRFGVASLTALPLPDASLAGAVAWYSLIHLTPQDRPAACAELARVLRPGGVLLTAFQAGDGPVGLAAAYGHAWGLAEHFRLPPEEMAGLLGDGGLPVVTRVLQEPVPPQRSPQAYLVARRE